MSRPSKARRTARCSCGRVELEAIGAPIMSVACYCDDCQEGSRQIEALPNGRPAQDPDGGTALVLYLKDRVTCSTGAPLLKALKIREKSPTNRVVATCCNSAMMLNFDNGLPWLSVYRARFQGDVPPAEARIQTKFKPEGTDIPNDVPSYATFPLKFPAKVVAAWIAKLLFAR